MLKLIFTSPEFAHEFVEFPDGVFSVGRSRRNQIIIEDPSVSKEHAELLVHGSEFIIRERGSQNGTFVGGVRIKAQSGVKHGQKIRFGRVELLLEIGPPEYDESTNISAVTCLARIRENEARASRPPTQFPVRFIPQDAAAQGISTLASPCPIPEPVLPAPPGPSQNPQPSNLNESWRTWVWLVISFVALFLTASWLLKR